MEEKPTTDLTTLAPILLGALSLIGIAAVFIYGRMEATRPPSVVTPTETAFKYIYLGTEPGLSTLTPEATPTAIFTPTVSEPMIITFTPAANNIPSPIFPTSPILPTLPGGPTPTVTPTLPAILSKVDDTYFEILYDGDWVAQSNVSGTHQNTLHISFTAGNSASYTFAGQQVIISSQAGPSLGKVSVNLDGLVFELDQTSAETQLKDWRSPLLVKGTHTLVITHLSGGSVNLDSITIPDVATPTPTVTSTAP